MRAYLGSRPGRAHLRAILAMLSNTATDGGTTSTPPLRRAVDLMRSRGVLVLISDLYEDGESVEGELRRAARMGHDVTVFHVLAAEELDWPWTGDLEIEDSETGRRVLTSTGDAAAYRSRMAEFVQRWRDRCTAAGIVYVLARTDAPPDHILREYLLQRGTGTA